MFIGMQHFHITWLFAVLYDCNKHSFVNATKVKDLQTGDHD